MEERLEHFTPGPWHIRMYNHHTNRKSFIVRRTHKVVNQSELRVICTVASGCNADGNLDLIAVAPEMYAELADLLDAMERGLFPQVAPGVDYPSVMEKKHELRKLLAKARGEN